MRINNKHTDDDSGGGARRDLTDDVYSYTATQVYYAQYWEFDALKKLIKWPIKMH